MLYKPEWGVLSAIALLLWIPFGLWLFTRQRPTRAATHVLVWGMMWLPEAAAFDLPVLPPLDKYMICALVALIGVRWKAPKRLRAARVWRGYDWAVIALLTGLIMTVKNNGETLWYGQIHVTELPALEPYDWLYMAIGQLITVLIPCVLGRSLLRTRRDLIDVLTILVTAGLVYTVPILWELRMSPMLHMHVYGFMPRTDWLQNMRQGGWRPTVFMGHGLVIGFFMFLCTTAAITLKRAGMRRVLRAPMWIVILYLFAMLVLCKAMGALIYGAIAYALMTWLSVKNRMRVLTLFVLIVAAYPTSRMLDLFPVEAVIDAAKGTMGPDRAQSLEFRFDNEDLVLSKGSQKLWFGWGGFARDHVYDPYLGKDMVIQDGHWIVVFGHLGLWGFICTFSLILIPILKARKATAKLRGSDGTLLSGLAVITTICAVNLLPNMALPNLQLFFAAGLAVLGVELPRQARLALKAKQQPPAPPPSPTAPLPTEIKPPARVRGATLLIYQPPKD